MGAQHNETIEQPYSLDSINQCIGIYGLTGDTNGVEHLLEQ